MPQISTLSNPTDLRDIPRSRFNIEVGGQGEGKEYVLSHLDISDLGVPESSEVIVIARRGNSEVRTSHGSCGSWHRDPVDIAELASDGVLRFRVLVTAPGSRQLIASAENVRPSNMPPVESFIALEPADLGNVPWEFDVLEQEGRAVIRFNREIFASTAEAEAHESFSCFVFPEAWRRLCSWYSEDADRSSGEEWDPFRRFLGRLSIDVDISPFGEDERTSWIGEAVGAFCNWAAICDHLKRARVSGGEAE